VVNIRKFFRKDIVLKVRPRFQQDRAGLVLRASDGALCVGSLLSVWIGSGFERRVWRAYMDSSNVSLVFFPLSSVLLCSCSAMMFGRPIINWGRTSLKKTAYAETLSHVHIRCATL
jgi:hypothetical protein